MSNGSPLVGTGLPLARRELCDSATNVRGQRLWTVKDPVSLRYYHLREEEYFILGLLNGGHTLDDMVALFEERFAPRRIQKAELAGFIGMLHREGLTVATAAGQAEHLLARRKQRQREKWLGRITNVLAIRFGSINPTSWLNRIVPRLGPLFSPWFRRLVFGLIVVAIAVVVSRFDQLRESMPQLQDLVAPANLFWLAVVLAGVKSLHELGHAVACKYFGGECNRIGLMLLVFTPALYCDVSDAWMFPDRRRRIAVSAAGMVVELTLAAAATLVWAVTQPGWLNAMCLNVMLVCSVGTLLINGNPLLRYDGYYILSDLVGAPNLQQQASVALRRSLGQIIAGVSDHPPRLATEPPLPLLLGYAIASTFYRWLVIAGILWVLYVALAPHGLTVLAGILTIVVVGTAATTALIPLWRFLVDPGRRATVQVPRLVAWLTALILCGIVLFFTPLPYQPAVPVILRAQNATRVYVTTPGILESVVGSGTSVTAGQKLAQLGNHDLEFEVATLTARRNQQRLHLEQLRLRRHDVESLGNQLPAAEKVLADLEQQLIQRERELQRLALVSPAAGTVIPPRSRPPRRTPGELASYAGTPLDEVNRGCYLETGTVLCLVGDPQRTEAVALVDESLAPHVRPGQQARIQFDEAPGTIVSGHIVRISQLSSSDVPPELLAAGEIALEKSVGSVRPQGNYYEVLIELESPATSLLIHAPGKAAIEVDPQPLSARLYRSIRSVFRLPW